MSPSMNRRDAVKYISLIMGSAMIGSTGILSGCKSSAQQGLFSEAEINFLDEIGDTIIPATDTPGAKAAGIGAFMALMVNDTYDDEDQIIFKEGITQLQDRAVDFYQIGFLELNSEQKHELLNRLNVEQTEYYKTKKQDEPPHYFRMMKELTLLGYFTSEIGVTQARRYHRVPGKFESCIDYSKGEKAWVYN